jgi:hypothetical protein
MAGGAVMPFAMKLALKPLRPNVEPSSLNR